ncbi:MAG TPA: hypothetical protein VGC66_14005 [Pyrinomonadaceae bacterium]|jgi:hypothetical protein
MMQKWEYKVIHGTPSEHELNLLGEEGWELVAVVDGGSEKAPHDKETFGAWGANDVYMYLKRPKF